MPENKRPSIIWVNWEKSIVSFHKAPGFDMLSFASLSTMQANLQILLSEGFLFQ